jgi:hypothetical protein
MNSILRKRRGQGTLPRLIAAGVLVLLAGVVIAGCTTTTPGAPATGVAPTAAPAAPAAPQVAPPGGGFMVGDKANPALGGALK